MTFKNIAPFGGCALAVLAVATQALPRRSRLNARP